MPLPIAKKATRDKSVMKIIFRDRVMFRDFRFLIFDFRFSIEELRGRRYIYFATKVIKKPIYQKSGNPFAASTHLKFNLITMNN